MLIDVKQDLQQRERALTIHESFIIQAPAGSGKTELLIQRMLVLLAHVNSPEEVLAITFTKKAANEMRERVFDALKEAAHLPEPESPHKRKTWQLASNVLQRDREKNWQLLNNPNQLQIKTIDSFCSYLTTQMPLLAQFGSQPTIAETPAYLYEETVEQVLLQIEEDSIWSESIAALLLHLDNDLNSLKKLLIGLLTKRDQWLPYIFSHDTEQMITDLLEEHVAMVAADSITTLKEIFPAELAEEATALAIYAANNLGLSLDPTNLTLSFATIFLTKEFAWRKMVNAQIGFPAPSDAKNAEEKKTRKEYKDRASDLILQLSSNEELRLALEDISRLPRTGIQKIESGILEHLIPVLKLTAAQLRVTFQQYGKIDFIENTQAALTALGNEDAPTNIALALDYKIQHILIDEFQDTSSTQYRLLQKLTHGWQSGDGRSLFVVGDPMQSIYRFREAEVGLFLRMRAYGLGEIKLIPLTLSLNFRSTPEIIAWNNQHFSAIFPQQTNPATGAVNYSPSVTPELTTNQQGNIEINGFDLAAEITQANFIVEKIKSLQQQFPDDNIAILVRARTHLKSIIATLRENNLSYQAIEIDPLSNRQMIQDLLSLTAALLHPADRVAWLAILRAPWCGLSLKDLLIITDCDKQEIIWNRIKLLVTQKTLSQHGQQALTRIFPILERALALRGRCLLREWIESTWLLLGGPACLSNEADIADTQTFFATLAELDGENIHFNTEHLKEKINKAYAAATSDAKLQIMTIHAAKGLEFDSVILPHLEKSLPSDNNSLLLWMEHTLKNKKTALLLAPIKGTGEMENSTYTYIKWQQKLKLQFETDRLFYVAATRAKKRLYMSYDRISKSNKNSFLSKLKPFITEEILSKQTSNDQERTPPQPHLSRLSLAWTNPLQLISQPKISKHNTFTGFILRSDTAKKLGTIIHAILQQIANHSMQWWQQLSVTQQTTLINNLLNQKNIITTDALPTVLRAITNTVNDARGQWILHSHQDAQAELAITALIGNEYCQLVIDRTFVDEQGIRWIIDYKSSQPPENLSRDDFIQQEKEAYAVQMQKYADAMQCLHEGTIKLGLYFPLVQGWIEWTHNQQQMPLALAMRQTH